MNIMSVDQQILRVIDGIDKYSKFFSDTTITSEIVLNSNILEVKKISWNELFQYLYQRSKDEMSKGNILYAEVNLGSTGLIKIILINDKIISLQLGSELGNSVINIIKSLKQEYVDVALNTIKISSLSKKLQTTLEDVMKLNVNEIIMQPIIKQIKPLPSKEEQPITQALRTVELQQVCDKIYNLIYSIACKYKINIASATITVKNSEAHVKISITPPKSFTAYYSMMISRSLDKFYSELEKELKNLNYVPKIEMITPEEERKEQKRPKLPSGEPHI